MINGMVGMHYYDLPILRLIIGAAVDKVRRECKSLVSLSRPHSVGFSPPIASYEVISVMNYIQAVMILSPLPSHSNLKNFYITCPLSFLTAMSNLVYGQR